MNKKILATALTTALLLTGCAAESNPSSEVAESKNTPQLTDYFLVTNVYGDGQKPWYVALEYDTEIAADSVDTDDFTVENHEIEAVYVSTAPEIPEESTDGSYLLIALSTDYTTSNYGGSNASAASNQDISSDFSEDDASSGNGNRKDLQADDSSEGASKEKKELKSTDEASSEGREGRLNNGGTGGGRSSLSTAQASNELTITFELTGELTTTDGTAVTGSGESCTTDASKNTNLLVENFTQEVFTTEDATELMYSLFLPDGYDTATAYPLVLFMPDATGEGDDTYLALTESLGGVIWTQETWQEEYPCIVLVPQYTEENTGDDAYTMELVNEIAAQYSVDTNRLYLVGQSSGTIRSLKLMIDYPDTFAGAMLVAGQADSDYEDKLAQLADQNIWFIASEGDARAYPGIQAIVDAVEAEGTEVTIDQWSAQLEDEEQETLAKAMEEAGTSMYWTVYDANTVMRDDVTASDATEHMNTWRVAYNLDTVREWLFAQTK